jgi:pimeloyl-ACP methyl ester carboxylesterase
MLGLVVSLPACDDGNAPTPIPTSIPASIPCMSNLTENCTAGRANVNDIAMYYEIHGVGEPVLLLHGALHSLESFRNQIPVLAKHFQVIAIDSRCHGRTTDSDRELSYALMANDTVTLLDHLEIDRTHVVGWSDGGDIGLELAINHPERVSRLVTIEATFSTQGVAESFAALVDTWDVGGDSQIHKWKRMWITRPDYTYEELDSIQAPTLVLCGEKEDYVKLEHSKELHQAIPNSQLAVIEGTGHFAPQTKPNEVNEAILTFLTDVD